MFVDVSNVFVFFPESAHFFGQTSGAVMHFSRKKHLPGFNLCRRFEFRSSKKSCDEVAVPVVDGFEQVSELWTSYGSGHFFRASRQHAEAHAIYQPQRGRSEGKKKVELDFDRFLVNREDHIEMKILNSEGIIIL